jgi:transcriptional regulator with XRE-family HTH domain
MSDQRSAGGSTGSTRGFDSAKLRDLFDTRRWPDGGKYTNLNVADAIGKTREFVRKLRSGDSAPSAETVADLAEVFDVPPSYFYSDAKSEAINAQYDLVLALANGKDGPARLRALRQLADAKPEDLPKITRAIENALGKANQ